MDYIDGYTFNLVGNDKYGYVEEGNAILDEDNYSNADVFAVMKKANGKYDVIRQSYEDSCEEDYTLSLGVNEKFAEDLDDLEKAKDIMLQAFHKRESLKYG